MPTASSDDLRLAALDRCDILDTPPDTHFDRIARLAARLFSAPMAAISFVTRDRSWFKSTYGFTQTEVARSASFCSHTITSPEALVVTDARADERFSGLVLVAGHPRVRFYAGAPVVVAGCAVGAVAVMDPRPRGPLSESETRALQDFGALVSLELNRRASAGAVDPGCGDSSILSAIIESAEDAIVSTDLNGVILTWNPGAERLCGYSAAEALGRSISLTIPPDRLEEAREMIAKARRGQPTLRCETFRTRKDGARRFVSLSITAIQDAEGKPIGIAGIAHDITALKDAEAAQRETEDRLRLAHEVAGICAWEWSVPSGGAPRPGQEVRIYGLHASESTMSYAQWLSAVHPEDLDRVRAYHEVLLREVGQGVAEFRIFSPDGGVRWVVSKGEMKRGPTAGADRVVGVQFDVTNLREAELSRRESEERHADLFRSMNQAVVYLDGEGVVLSVNPAAEKLFGLTVDELRGRRRSDLHFRATRDDGTPISTDEFPSMLALRTASERHGGVLRVWNARTGEPHWVSTDVFLRVQEGETHPRQIHVIITDITAQFEAEARLRTSEERHRLLIEHGMEVIGVIDPDAIVTFMSPSVERVFGFPPDLVVGANATDYVHPDDRPAVQHALESILRSPPDAAVTLQVRLRHHDGDWRTVEGAATNCLHVEGLRGIVINLKDISKRVRYEEQLRGAQDQLRLLAARVESAREEESARISREIHDEFGQMLSLLKLELETLAAEHRSGAAEARGGFEKRIAGMVRSLDLAVNTVRRIAAELRPAVFADLGIAAALTWQLQEFESRTGIRCRGRGLDQDPGLAAGPALAAFRICQEALTNVVRHAKATRLDLAVETDSVWFTLRVSDNGIGFDPKLLTPSRSLGLLGMQERASMHGGTVEWSGRRGGGSRVTVRLPREGDSAVHLDVNIPRISVTG